MFLTGQIKHLKTPGYKLRSCLTISLWWLKLKHLDRTFFDDTIFIPRRSTALHAPILGLASSHPTWRQTGWSPLDPKKNSSIFWEASRKSSRMIPNVHPIKIMTKTYHTKTAQLFVGRLLNWKTSTRWRTFGWRNKRRRLSRWAEDLNHQTFSEKWREHAFQFYIMLYHFFSINFSHLFFHQFFSSIFPSACVDLRAEKEASHREGRCFPCLFFTRKGHGKLSSAGVKEKHVRFCCSLFFGSENAFLFGSKHFDDLMIFVVACKKWPALEETAAVRVTAAPIATFAPSVRRGAGAIASLLRWGRRSARPGRWTWKHEAGSNLKCYKNPGWTANLGVEP